MNFLLTDDEPLQLQELTSILRRIRPEAQVFAYAWPDDALEGAKSNSIDVAFLDIQTGGMSGLELALELKRLQPGVHIIFVTGCKNRHPSPICTRFEHHFHALKPHLHRRSFSDTLPENQRHLIALKRHPLWHMQKLCQLSQPAELRSTFFRNRNAVLCQDVLQLSNPLALSLEFFLSCVKVFHRLTLHLVVAGPFQF